ncbi:Prolyl oligopeptidase family protein [Halobacillus alkaliphilus]|uniref:Prolyl oligopeptidase family protein n=1 Tax=Halobacillus alkaliphilus TaxID=396056 RepID=A0A1I2TPS1_9BACI|nr:Prolyl oligopeptidase family protein [Halobacillus alkaliphilus]
MGGASSYSTNGYDVKQGVVDTHALGKFFNGKIANPKRTYVVGHSMGGHITGVLIEQYRDVYDGAMPMCGVMGDNELFDFFADFNLASQVLAGIEPQFPAPDNYQTHVVPKIKQTMGLNTGLLTAEGEMLQDLTMYLSGGERPLFDLAFSSWNNFLFTLYRSDFSYGTPGNISDNTDSVYQLDSNSELSVEEMDLAEKIPEITADPQARNKNGLSKIPRISGELHQPVLTLHTLGDLFVPFSMEQLYAEKVAANGDSDLLVSRAVRAVGHCEFTPEEETEGFADLTDWVENGIKPEGDAILDPEVVSQDDFGIKFTNPIRMYDPLLSLKEE